jgi:hypothetical protein
MTMRNIILVVLALLLVFTIGSAQVFTFDKPLTSRFNNPYFSLSATQYAGDSTNTLGLDIRHKVLYHGQYISLLPDSAKLIVYASADSTYSVKFSAKARYTTQVSTYFATVFLDSIYSTTATATMKTMTVPDTLLAYSAEGNGFGISARILTGQNAVRYTTASKIYAVLRLFFHLP